MCLTIAGEQYGSRELNSDTSKLKPLAPEKVQAIYDQHVEALRRFLVGVLRDPAAAADALQTSFMKLMEKGHLVQQQESMRSWLFRVAFNEAMLIKRRISTGRKHAQAIAWKSELSAGAEKGADPRLSQSVHFAIRQEEVAKVREALTRIPELQRKVVELRIYEGLKFREIADQLGEPLGTVLARMQAGLKKLKPILNESLNELLD